MPPEPRIPPYDASSASAGAQPSDEADAADGHRGHRARLRRRFLEAGPDAMSDHELLEFLLFHSIPQKDTKGLAKQLIRRCCSVWEAVNAPPAALMEFPNVKETTVGLLHCVGAVALRHQRQQVLKQPVLSSWTRLL